LECLEQLIRYLGVSRELIVAFTDVGVEIEEKLRVSVHQPLPIIAAHGPHGGSLPPESPEERRGRHVDPVG
jgi:hypothetical protein